MKTHNLNNKKTATVVMATNRQITLSLRGGDTRTVGFVNVGGIKAGDRLVVHAMYHNYLHAYRRVAA